MKYVCELCGFVYDEALGDPRHGIPAGTAFAALPASYGCRCGSEKEAFCKAEKKEKRSSAAGCQGAQWRSMKYTDGPHISER